MTKLECHVNPCTDNSANFRCLPNIRVSGAIASDSKQTCYSSYVSQQDGTFSNSMVDSIPSGSVPIDCTATNCSYNAGGSCAASNICISGSGAPERGETNCPTFHQS